MDIEIVLRRPEDDLAIRALLEAAGLPIADLSPGLLERFLVARADGVVVGAVGLELFGQYGLLRSLVVHPAQRGFGLGAAMVAQLERLARAAGGEELYLLTTSAAPFFQARGYRPLDRSQVPSPVAPSAEFRGLCPSSAVCLCKRLGPGGAGT